MKSLSKALLEDTFNHLTTLKAMLLRQLMLLSFFFILLSNANYAQSKQWQTAYDTIPQSPDTLRFTMLKKLTSKTIFAEPEFTLKLIGEQQDIANRLRKSELLAEVNYLNGIYQSYHGSVDSSLLYFQQARDHYAKSGNKNQTASANNSIGIILRKKGEYDNALTHHFDALQIFETLNDSASVSKVHNAIGNVYVRMGEKSKAEEQFQKVLAFSEQVGNEVSIADALSNISVTIEDQKEKIKLNKRAVDIYKKLNMTYKMMASLLDIGHAYEKLGQSSQALKYYEQVRPLAKKISSKEFYADLLRDIGTNYSKLGKHKEAIPSVERAVFLFDSLSLTYKYANAIEILTSVQARAGKYKEAYQSALKFYSLNDSLKSLQVLEDISELETKYETAKKDKEIALLSKDAELAKVKTTRLWIVLIASGLLGALLFWLQRMRSAKQKAIETEKRKVAELKNQQLHQELDFKKKELTSKVLQLCRKNEFLTDLAKQVKDIKTDGASSQQLNKLGRRINRDIDMDADWALFLQSFETVHPDFNKKINEVHPDLTSGEHRMACLMKMNLDSKEVASLLNISLEGVKKARYRMRKKMNLDSAENLNAYFLKF